MPCNRIILTNWWSPDLPPELRELPPDQLNLVINDLKNLVSGQHRLQHAPIPPCWPPPSATKTCN
jgi:hypothetical protein